MTTDPTDHEALALEVERRLWELRENPEEFLRRFDRNGDGVLDHDEWGAARATTLIHLATSRHPSELQTDGPKLAWRSFAKLSLEFSRWIDALTAPMVEDRFPSAVLARARLHDEKTKAIPLNLGGEIAKIADDIEANELGGKLVPVTRGKPDKCKIAIKRSDDRIAIDLAPKRDLRFFGISVAGVWVGLAIGTWRILNTTLPGHYPPVLHLLLAGLLFGAVAIPLGVYKFWHPIIRVTGSPSGLVLHRRGTQVVRGLPLNEIAGPELVAARSGTRVRLVCHEGRAIQLDVMRRRKDAEWLSTCLREYLVERRMARHT